MDHYALHNALSELLSSMEIGDIDITPPFPKESSGAFANTAAMNISATIPQLIDNLVLLKNYKKVDIDKSINHAKLSEFVKDSFRRKIVQLGMNLHYEFENVYQTLYAKIVQSCEQSQILSTDMLVCYQKYRTAENGSTTLLNIMDYARLCAHVQMIKSNLELCKDLPTSLRVSEQTLNIPQINGFIHNFSTAGYRVTTEGIHSTLYPSFEYGKNTAATLGYSRQKLYDQCECVLGINLYKNMQTLLVEIKEFHDSLQVDNYKELSEQDRVQLIAYWQKLIIVMEFVSYTCICFNHSVSTMIAVMSV